MIIHAVTFDCWGTLLVDSPGSDERYGPWRVQRIQTVLERLGTRVERERLDRAYEASGRWLAQLWRQGRDVPVDRHVSVLLEMVDPVLPARLRPKEFAAVVDAYAGPARLAPPAVDPAARTILESLNARGIALAVVSNIMRTPGDVLEHVFRRARALEPLKLLTFSDECGIRKPDPEIFHLTLRQIGVAPEEAVHVGDDPILDVEGARDAGMAVIQVSPDGRAPAPVKPDAVITSLGDLPAALDRLAAAEGR
jgi:putative hydrolase of the HAD superfamily